MSERRNTGLRLLTLGEIRLCKSVFGESIQYNKVWIHHDSFIPFGMQDKETSMAPLGELYFLDWYCDDFSVAGYQRQQVFIHEMTHVWQRTRGMNVLIRGLVSGIVSYRYRLDGRPLRRYPMEKQAQIVADNFILTRYGYDTWMSLWYGKYVTLDGDLREAVIRPKYQQALRLFPWE